MKDRRQRAEEWYVRHTSGTYRTTAGLLSGYWPESPAMPVTGMMAHEARRITRGALTLAELDGRNEDE